MNDINHTIFREYDIRGIINKTLMFSDAFLIGRSFSTELIEKKGNKLITIAVGRDGRLTSKKLLSQLIKGLNASGANVINIGCGPTPMLYFAREFLNCDGAIMVTGSHNPPDHNGFKIMDGPNSFFGKALLGLKKRIIENNFNTGHGKFLTKSVFEEYKNTLIEKSYKFEPLNVVWDCGNGSSGKLITQLVKELPGNHKVIFGEIDGNFPNHHPDPTDPKNLKSLIKEVKKNNSDLGFAFDGDGDRIGVVSNDGKYIPGDFLTAYLSGTILNEHKNSTIILDIKSSDSALDSIKFQSGKPLLWKTGHSLIKSKIKKTGALLAGEMSGHIFFSDRWYGFDDATYAALRVINEYSRRKVSIGEFVKSLPVSYSTPEIRVFCKDDEKFEVTNRIRNKIKKTNLFSINNIDGIRASNKDGWFLFRASNTQEAIIVRAEAKTKKTLESFVITIKNLLEDEKLFIDD